MHMENYLFFQTYTKNNFLKNAKSFFVWLCMKGDMKKTNLLNFQWNERDVCSTQINMRKKGNQTKCIKKWLELKENKCEITCSIKDSKMQREGRTITHENPQTMSIKKQHSRLGCGKKESHNHHKARYFKWRQKGSKQRKLCKP